MEFNEMKKVWDSQNNQPLFAIDEVTLHKQVNKKIDSTKRSANKMEYGLIAINIFVIVFLTVKGILNDYDWLNFITAGAAFFILLYVVVGRQKRLQKGISFERTLLGELDNAISNMDYLISRGKTFVWWYMLPFVCTILLTYYFKEESRGYAHWVVMFIMFIVAAWLPQWEVKNCHIPKRKTLLSMRHMLTQE